MTPAQATSHLSGPFRARRPTPVGWVVLAIVVLCAVTAVTYFRERRPRPRFAPAVLAEVRS